MLQGSTPAAWTSLPAQAPDLFFIAEHSPVHDLVKVVAASGSGLAFVSYTNFHPTSLLDDVHDDNGDPGQAQPDESLSTAMAKMLEDALRRQGELCQVTLTWSLNGLLCYWQANARWAQDLQVAFDEAQESAAGGSA